MKQLTQNELAIIYQDTEGKIKTKALEEIISRNEGYLFMFIKKHKYQDQGDVRNYLVLATETALKRFDRNKGVSFPSYLVWWLRSYSNRYAREHALVKFPYNHRPTKKEKAVRKLLSLNYSIPDSNIEFVETLHTEPDELNENIFNVVAPLLEHDERLTIDYIYKKQCTIQEAGDRMGVSKEWARVLRDRGLRKIKKAFKSYHISDFLQEVA